MNDRLPAVPDELKALPQWVVRRGKVPLTVNPRTSDKPGIPPASSTDPATWAPYEAVILALEAGRLDGAGFVFSADDEYIFIDLDHCRDPLTGIIESWALIIIARLCSYTEISPSGTGIHIIVRGKLPPGGRKRGNVEMYDSGRYATMTGNRITFLPATIEERSDVVAEIHGEVFGAAQAETVATPPGGRPALSLEDDEVLQRARSASNGALFIALYDRGDLAAVPKGDGSQNSADLALCNMLRFWTGGDPQQMDRLFRAGALMRPKWDKKRGEETYGERTIKLALPGDVYSPRSTWKVELEPDPAPEAGTAPNPCSDLVAAMQARIDQLEAALAEKNAALIEAQRRFQLLLGIDRNPAIKTQRTVIKAAAWEMQSAMDTGRTDKDGWIKVWREGIAKNAGVGADTAGDHLEAMKRDELIDKKVVKERPEKIDPETGELVPDYDQPLRPHLYIRPRGTVTDLLQRAATWQPSPPPAKPQRGTWGGKRKGCDLHPNAGTITREVCAAPGCGRPVAGERQDDAHGDTRPGVANTFLHRQDDAHGQPPSDEVPPADLAALDEQRRQVYARAQRNGFRVLELRQGLEVGPGAAAWLEWLADHATPGLVRHADGLLSMRTTEAVPA